MDFINELEKKIGTFASKGITEYTISDAELSKNKKALLKVLNLFNQKAPDLYLNILIDAHVIDKEIALAASNLFCSIDVPLECENKGGKLLFDKKFYAGKAAVLNNYGLVFGFYLTYAVNEGDSLKAFMDRLDFAVNQYPNHIDFPQTEDFALKDEKSELQPAVTGLFSAKDIRYARDVSFACRTFYTEGRAVPWFLSVLKPLRIYPSRFFADFAEWQRCNNCDFKSGFVPEKENHKAIEKMQLLFLEEKYEEKKSVELLTLVKDLVSFNGAMSRLAGENEECVIETSYNPDDLLSEEVYDLASFCENVCMLNCKVKIFAGEEGPDYSVIN